MESLGLFSVNRPFQISRTHINAIENLHTLRSDMVICKQNHDAVLLQARIAGVQKVHLLLKRPH